MSTTLAWRGVGAWLFCCTVILGCGVDPRTPLVGAIEETKRADGGLDGARAGDAGATRAGESGTPRLKLSAASVDLGPVAMGFSSRSRLTVSNEGDAPLAVPEVTWAEPSDADFAVVQNRCLKQIAPNEQCELRVQFVPSKAGPSSATLRVAGAAVEPADVPFSAVGLLASKLLAVPAAGSFEDFGEVVVGQTAEGVFRILNPGGEPSGALAFSVNQPAFVFLPPTAEPTSTEPPCEAGASLGAGASCELRIGFTPNARGPIEATLTTILDEVGGVSATLLGEGIVAGLLGVSEATLDFEGVIPGRAAQRNLTLENEGDLPLTLGSAELEPAAGVFSVLNSTCGAGVALGAGARCSVDLEFRPTDADVRSEAELVVGVLEGEQVQRIALTGLALQPGNMVVAPPAPGEENFGDVLLGENLVRVFQISNPGAQPSGLLELAATNGFVTDPGTAQGDCTAETSLVDNQSCAVHVRFAPRERGAAAGVLTVSSELAGASSLSLSGSGLAPAAVDVAAEVNFGRLTTGESGQSAITVRNTGDQPLPPPTFQVSGVNPAQARAFTFVSGCSAPLGLEESCEVTLAFAPTLASPHSATLDLTAEPGGRASVLLLGQAIVPGSLVLAPAEGGSTDFGDVAIGASGSSFFTLTNPGGEPAGALTLRSDNAAFAVSPGDCNEGDPAGLIDGAACTFEVTFTPTDRKPAAGRLLALSGALGEVNVQLRGRGRGPAKLEATLTRDLGQANLGVDPGPLNQFTWTVNNTGDLPSGELALANTNRAEFELSNDTCSGSEVAARASCQVLIGFRPSEAGPRTGSITITDADSATSLALTLTGLGQRIAQPGESCVNATCAEGFCTAGKCCDRACDRTCQVCSDAGSCVDQVSLESCGSGSGRCFGVEQCLLPAGAPCAADADCGGGLVCKDCAAGGKQCTAPADCCGECPDGLTCVGGSCGCAANQTPCGGGLCIPEGDPLACCPGSVTSCPASAPLCTASGRCAQCLTDDNCRGCETCNDGLCSAISRGQAGRCPLEAPLCDGAGECFAPPCTIEGSAEGCSACSKCESFACVQVGAGDACTIGTGLCNAGGGCVSCLDGSQCPACQVCSPEGACQPVARGEAEQPSRCPGGGDLCNGQGACFSPACTTEGSAAGCPECNVCRDFACASAAPDTACTNGPGVCDGAGSCRCALDADCPVCQGCAAGACVPVEPGQAGRCPDPAQVCDAAQQCVAPPECSDDGADTCGPCAVCQGGSCQALPEESVCGTGTGPGFCNAEGACEQCFEDDHCGFCQRCETNTCQLVGAGEPGRCSQEDGLQVCDGISDACIPAECPTPGLQEGCGGCEICVDFVCQVNALAFGASCDLDEQSADEPPGFCINGGVCVQCIDDTQCIAPQICDIAAGRCID
jgi:hypothetical protein